MPGSPPRPNMRFSIRGNRGKNTRRNGTNKRPFEERLKAAQNRGAAAAAGQRGGKRGGTRRGTRIISRKGSRRISRRAH